MDGVSSPTPVLRKATSNHTTTFVPFRSQHPSSSSIPCCLFFVLNSIQSNKSHFLALSHVANTRRVDSFLRSSMDEMTFIVSLSKAMTIHHVFCTILNKFPTMERSWNRLARPSNGLEWPTFRDQIYIDSLSTCAPVSSAQTLVFLNTCDDFRNRCAKSVLSLCEETGTIDRPWCSVVDQRIAIRPIAP